jgi:hypothetical protein
MLGTKNPRLPATGPPKSFTEATAVQPIDSHTYSAFCQDDWTIGTGELNMLYPVRLAEALTVRPTGSAAWRLHSGDLFANRFETFLNDFASAKPAPHHSITPRFPPTHPD